ncbi:hypothetical protein phiK7B1_147 [Pseudomonas phage phiK7B1]|nr:hypothetical protein phiK7B1_147 [Pseudomonas phage phiK7B1]
MHLETAQAVHPLRELPMKLLVTGFIAKPGQEFDDHTYTFKATISGVVLWFELTVREIAEIVEGRSWLPEQFDFGMREPVLCSLVRMVHMMYWKDEEGVLLQCQVELSSPKSDW